MSIFQRMICNVLDQAVQNWCDRSALDKWGELARHLADLSKTLVPPQAARCRGHIRGDHDLQALGGVAYSDIHLQLLPLSACSLLLEL